MGMEEGALVLVAFGSHSDCSMLADRGWGSAEVEGKYSMSPHTRAEVVRSRQGGNFLVPHRLLRQNRKWCRG